MGTRIPDALRNNRPADRLAHIFGAFDQFRPALRRDGPVALALSAEKRPLGDRVLLLATYWPALLYLPSTTNEGLNYALAFVLAAVVERNLAQVQPQPRSLAVVFGVVLAASLFRVTWCLLLVPCVFVGLRRTSLRKKMLWAFLALAMMGVLGYLTKQLSAPFPNFFANLLQIARNSPREGMNMALERCADGLQRFILPREESKFLEILMRYEVLAVVLVGFAGAIAARKKHAQRFAALSIATLNLGLIVFALCMFYDITGWRDFRVLGPHLLLSLLLMLSRANCKWFFGYAAINLLLLFAFVNQFAEFYSPRLRADMGQVLFMERVFRSHIAFAPEGLAWDNTLLVPADIITYPLVSLPPGINMSYVLDINLLPLPPRSKYLLLKPPDFRALQGQVNLRSIVHTPLGTLYLNLDRPGNGGE